MILSSYKGEQIVCWQDADKDSQGKHGSSRHAGQFENALFQQGECKAGVDGQFH